MEIRQERIDHAKAESGEDKQSCFRLSAHKQFRRMQFGSSQSGGFQSAYNGSANGKNRSTGSAGVENTFCGRLRNFVRLGVHGVTVESLGVDRLECSQTDLERQLANLRATLPYLLKNLRCEVQARRG